MERNEKMIDPNDLNNLKLQLTLRMSHGALAFAVGDPKTDGKMVYEPYSLNGSISLSANLREAFANSELLMSGYKHALLLTDSIVMLVPKEEYKEEQAALLYRTTVGGHDKDDIARAELPELNAVAVFAVNHDVRIVIQDHFANINILPVVLPVWRHLYRKAFTGPRAKLFAYFHDKRVNIFRFDHARFRYANCFDCAHSHDALYYILYVWKLLGMDNSNDELHLVGDIPHDDWLKENIARYLQRTFVINPAAEFNLNEMAKRTDIPYDIKALYL